MIVSDMTARVLSRLDQPGGVYYTSAEVLSALNEGLRFFALLTLGLESTVTLTISSGSGYNRMLSLYPDWLMPLRIVVNGIRLRPSRLADMDALDLNWQTAHGGGEVTTRYIALGLDMLIFYQLNYVNAAKVTYARAPVPLVNPGDSPEFPAHTHPAFVDYATYRVRLKEGGQEFQKGLGYLQSYLAMAKTYADYIRARNIGQRYDHQPFEFERVDLSKLLTIRKGLVPMRGGEAA